MGDVISSHLDEGKREIITARTGEVMGEFSRLYGQQYAVALFNQIRFDIEGGGAPQPQLLHRKVPLANKSIFSGALFQYLEENKKWRNRFLFVPDSYNIHYYENKTSHERGLHPKGTINCAGYKVLTSMEQYMELLDNSLPGVKAKAGSSPFLKCATQFPLILWHPYAHHYYFCVASEKEQLKWHAVFQDCVRHTNDGLSEESKVQTPAFTDTVRLYRQAKGQYGTWDMMCGLPAQILANLVMESLLPELRDLISPRLKGKLPDRQRSWMLISDAVYSLVQQQCQGQYEAVVQSCEEGRPLLETSIRTDMDQIITSKEHVTNKIRAVVLPKAEKLLKVSIEPYITSILDALMEPTSRGFSEVRDVFFRELVDMGKNILNDGSKEKVGEHMDKISMLAFHPVKMQSCYEKVEQLSLEGLQQRFDVSSPSVFVQRAQILMREQMDDAVYTFEQILHQNLEGQGNDGFCKTIQRCQDRVIKKFDYDSSTVRKRFFREALLQIFIPYMLKQLAPSCASELPRFQELIFEDFSKFILVENIFEEVVLHSVMKDIMMAVKEAAVQRRHNLYRDSIVLTNSDPNLHLLEDKPSIDWAEEYGAQEEAEGQEKEEEGAEQESGDGAAAQRRRRMKQVVSMIQPEDSPELTNESCLEVPGVEGIPEEEEEEEEEHEEEKAEASPPTESPDHETKNETSLKADILETPPALTNGSVLREVEMPEVKTQASPEPQEVDETESSSQDAENASAIQSAIQEIDNAVQEADIEQVTVEVDASPSDQESPAPSEEVSAALAEQGVLSTPTGPRPELSPVQEEQENTAEVTEHTLDSPPPSHDESGFQSSTSEVLEEEEEVPPSVEASPSPEVLQPQEEPPRAGASGGAVTPEDGAAVHHSDSETGEQHSAKSGPI
ncbi:protein Niban 2b isoform X1 [Osmerus mordax]|uniref:protein Niban 2b isoform X1 n=1 Tax=Osmerus mordax TaxID=8014 RepID=UPI00350F9467